MRRPAPCRLHRGPGAGHFSQVQRLPWRKPGQPRPEAQAQAQAQAEAAEAGGVAGAAAGEAGAQGGGRGHRRCAEVAGARLPGQGGEGAHGVPRGGGPSAEGAYACSAWLGSRRRFRLRPGPCGSGGPPWKGYQWGKRPLLAPLVSLVHYPDCAVENVTWHLD